MSLVRALSASGRSNTIVATPLSTVLVMFALDKWCGAIGSSLVVWASANAGLDGVAQAHRLAPVTPRTPDRPEPDGATHACRSRTSLTRRSGSIAVAWFPKLGSA